MVDANKGDAQLTEAHELIEAATNMLHQMVGTRQIEIAIACAKTAMYLIEAARDAERVKRHVAARDELL
jgi:hypothetical protein